jgi:hypothetical protein
MHLALVELDTATAWDPTEAQERFHHRMESLFIPTWVGPLHRALSKASIVTTHGEIVVPKFLAVKGPSGTYSHFCISRADQSFMITRPKIRSPALSMDIGSPTLFSSPPMKNAISSSMSSNLQFVKTGGLARIDQTV